MDFVRMRHGNAVWHRVTGREICRTDYQDDTFDEFLLYYTHCEPSGYSAAGPHIEMRTAEHPPGRLCRRCAKGMEVAA